MSSPSPEALALVNAIISAYHSTRLSEVPAAKHVLSSPMVQKAWADAFPAASADTDSDIATVAYMLGRYDKKAASADQVEAYGTHRSWCASPIYGTNRCDCDFKAIAAMPAPVITEAMVAEGAACLMSEVFAQAQPDRGDVFSWLDDRADDLVRIVLTAALGVQP